MLKQLIQSMKKRLPGLANGPSDLTGYAAVPVPLNRASCPGQVTLDLPGYAQVNSFCCGVVAGAMVLKHFRPRASFAQFHARVNPKDGAGTGKVVRALRQSGI